MNRLLTVDATDLIVIKDAGEVREYARLTKVEQPSKAEQLRVQQLARIVREQAPVVMKRANRFKRYTDKEDAVILRAYAKHATKKGQIQRSAMQRLSRKLGRDSISLSYRHRILTGVNP